MENMVTCFDPILSCVTELYSVAHANKFVEFYLVMDRAHYQLTGSNTDISRQYAIEVANHMDFIYRYYAYFIKFGTDTGICKL